MTSGILWQNEDGTVTLIDVPQSISGAQGPGVSRCANILLSIEPPQTPLSFSNASDQRRHSSDEVDDTLHDEYRALLGKALDEVKSCHVGDWCTARPYVTQAATRKRKLIDVGAADAVPLQDPGLPSDLLASISKSCLISPDVRAETDDESLCKFNYEPGSYLYGCSTRRGRVVLTSHDVKTAQSTDYKFRVPANTTFSLSDCANADVFHAVVEECKQEFAFILLDPPWPNRSVKRTHKTPGSSYATIDSLQDVKDLLLNMRIPRLLSAKGYVAIWITNKPAIRQLVFGSQGLFDRWGMELIEEWIWLKTTTRGDPITPIEGMWHGKKPYEVCLVARLRSASNTKKLEVQRRAIIGVPDLHSRKPCLKWMIEALVGNDACVLEVFARYLVAGWWSWGDEVLKFNWEGCWQSQINAELAETQPATISPD